MTMRYTKLKNAYCEDFCTEKQVRCFLWKSYENQTKLY